MNPPRPEDEEILAAVRALQAGAGPDAFEAVFSRFYRPLFLFFANRPALQEEADDLAQMTLLRAYQSIHQVRVEESFPAFQGWLWQIAENLWKNAVRHRQALKRGPLLASLDETSQEDEIPPEPRSSVLGEVPATPEEVALTQERVKILHAAIEGLPPGMRLCTKLRLFADLKYREISDATGIGISSVKSQLFEARKRLKPVLDEHFQSVEF